MNRAARYATFVVLSHAAVVFWHLVLVAKITPGLTDHQVLAATTAVNLVPTFAMVLLWAHFPRLGGFLLFLPLAVGLMIGGSEHFVTPGPLNVFYMANTPWVLPFRVTAVLLLVLEVVGCWIAIQAFRRVPFLKAEATQ
jgi:Na+/H+ antiporter NhaC